MACIVLAYTLMAYAVMAYAVMAYVVVACVAILSTLESGVELEVSVDPLHVFIFVQLLVLPMHRVRRGCAQACAYTCA